MKDEDDDSVEGYLRDFQQAEILGVGGTVRHFNLRLRR
jgi:hypothetical protein